MRRAFAPLLHKQMTLDTDIVLVVFDLGFGLWDQIRIDYPKRFYNLGAAEQGGMDVAIGMALTGKKVFVYSMPTFLIYRPFEVLRTYVNHEKIPLRLIGSGRDADYAHDGISHNFEDTKNILDTLPNITQYWPQSELELPLLVEKMASDNTPCFISLRR